jgi:hypothetical protein
MTQARVLDEIVAGCLAIVVLYHYHEKTRATEDMISQEIQALGELVSGMGLPEDAIECHVIQPFERELISHYGHEVGPRIASQFIDAFHGGTVHQA